MHKSIDNVDVSSNYLFFSASVWVKVLIYF